MPFSFMLHGKEEQGFVTEQQQQSRVQDINTTSSTFKVLSIKPASSDQSVSGTKKANWGNDTMLGSFGLSEHSSSSGFSTPFGSELGSTETDETESEEDEDFIFELTRQMAENMLKDDDEEEDVSINDNDVDEYKVLNYTPNILQTTSPCGLVGTWSNYNSSEICYYQESLNTYVKPMVEYSVDQMKSFNTTVLYSSDDLKRPIQVYHLKDQPTIRKSRPCNSKGKKGVKGTTTEKSKDQSTFIKKQTFDGHYHPIQSNGAGMRAVFLGGSGSINGSSSSGTGVFLPRRINPTSKSSEQKKKSGSSTVLIPARVIQALQLHFNQMDALSQSNTCAVSPTDSPTDHLPQYDAKKETKGMVSKENQNLEDETRSASVVNDQEMQLPVEWTY